MNYVLGHSYVLDLVQTHFTLSLQVKVVKYMYVLHVKIIFRI